MCGPCVAPPTAPRYRGATPQPKLCGSLACTASASSSRGRSVYRSIGGERTEDDGSTTDSAERAIAAIVQADGRLDGVVHNATSGLSPVPVALSVATVPRTAVPGPTISVPVPVAIHAGGID